MSENIEDLESHEGVDPIYDIHWEAWVDAYDNDSIESLQDIIREEDEQLAEFGIEPEQKYSPPIKTIMTPKQNDPPKRVASGTDKHDNMLYV